MVKELDNFEDEEMNIFDEKVKENLQLKYSFCCPYFIIILFYIIKLL